MRRHSSKYASTFCSFFAVFSFALLARLYNIRNYAARGVSRGFCLFLHTMVSIALSNIIAPFLGNRHSGIQFTSRNDANVGVREGAERGGGLERDPAGPTPHHPLPLRWCYLLFNGFFCWR